MSNLKVYNKEELFSLIDNISITKEGSQVITKFNNKVIKVTSVSNRYEIFNITKYLKDNIEQIENNFKINSYKLDIIGGKQYLQLVSDVVDIGGVEFYKSFYILNSSDKSRRLSFNVGLYSEVNKLYVIGSSNVGLVKKHLKGITKSAELASEGLNGETFDEQIKSMRSIVGHKVKFSKLRDIILGDEPSKLSHRKFDALKNILRYELSKPSNSKLINGNKLSYEQRILFSTKSEDIKEVNKNLDFYIDAFWVLQVYLRIFNKQDSHVIKNESERIMSITQCSIRNNILESLGI